MDPDIVVVPPANCLELGLAAGVALTLGITALFAVLWLQLVTMVWPPSARTDRGGYQPGGYQPEAGPERPVPADGGGSAVARLPERT